MADNREQDMPQEGGAPRQTPPQADPSEDNMGQPPHDMPEPQEGEMDRGVRHETLTADGGGHAGPIVGTIIVILVLVVGALYFFRDELGITGFFNAGEQGPSAQEVLEQEDMRTNALRQQSASDEIDAIEQDLNNTQLANLDAEFEQIEADLGI